MVTIAIMNKSSAFLIYDKDNLAYVDMKNVRTANMSFYLVLSFVSQVPMMSEMLKVRS